MSDSRVCVPQEVLESMLDALLSLQVHNALMDSPGYVEKCKLDMKIRTATAEFKRRCPHLSKRLAKESAMCFAAS